MKNNSQPGALVLSDGEVFEGDIYGTLPSEGAVSGEVVFNTVLCGYTEVITDPSYAGQIITFTYPHIGNYGVCPSDMESQKAHCRGVVARDIQQDYSNWQAQESLIDFLHSQSLAVISGVDTRRLTRHIRQSGSMPSAFGTALESELLNLAKNEPGTQGVDLVAEVSCRQPYSLADSLTYNLGAEKPKPLDSKKILAVDFGIKSSILRQLGALGNVEIMPAGTSAADVLARQPDGVFLSNGPGDPDCVPYARDLVENLLGQVPIFGICLGFQFLCQALGAKTYKLDFGHHGGNHPVMRLADGKVEVTSQNHNFAVDSASLDSGIEITHINLNDQTLEGICVPELKAMGVQYHPEAGPGPHDSFYLFQDFYGLMG